MNRRFLFLFDIDGTLIAPGTLPRKLLDSVIMEKAGASPELTYEDVAGFTDPLIVRNAIRKLNAADGDISGLVKQILKEYENKFAAQYSEESEASIYEDAAGLLSCVQSEGHAVGILTGNMRSVAKVKLERFGLWEEFPFGVFGDDADLRADMPWIARERSWDAYEESFQFRHMVIVGDTAEDAKAASKSGAKSIIVYRHPDHVQNIQKAEPTCVVDSLEKVDLHNVLK